MMRIGYGYDSHVFEDPASLGCAVVKPLVLGGVYFEGHTGLKGHSDADVLLHAVIDSLLGAAALGDIGSHFPDTDEKWKGADSSKLLAAVVEEISAAGYRLGNLDATVICEKPKLRPKVEAIRVRLAELLKVDISQISVKGKTNEKMDDVGAGRGILAHSVCLLEETK